MQKDKRVRQTTFTTEVGTTRTMKLLTSNTVLKGATILNIRTRRFGANRKSLQGKTIVNDANFESAILLFKVGSEIMVEIPVEHIETASKISPETGFPINIGEIDWNTSSVEVGEGIALDTGKVFEFTIEYTL